MENKKRENDLKKSGKFLSGVCGCQGRQKMKLPRHVEHIGRMAHILIPIAKIDKEINQTTVRQRLYNFLESAFGGFTEDLLVWGLWGKEREAHVRITVSFKGKENIFLFLRVLGKVCHEMREKCLYLEMGEESYLVKPIRSKKLLL